MSYLKARNDFVKRNRGRCQQIEKYDEAIVIRFMRGEQIKSNTSDRHEAVQRLLKSGMNCQQIARRTGLSDRTIYRIKNGR